MIRRLAVLGIAVGTLAFATTAHATGTFYLNGSTLTPAGFAFHANKTGDSALSFSATEATNVVPEPGSMMLLGTGLLGLGAAVRRKFAQKS